MTTTTWDQLPNARHIDRILADLKTNPEKWTAAYDAAWDAAYDAAWDAAYDAACDAAYDAAYDAACNAAWVAACDAARGAAWVAAWGAILALIAWDDCAYLLNQSPQEINQLVLLGNQQAILLEPAVLCGI